MDDPSHGSALAGRGLFAGITTVAKNGFGLFLNRIELAALELAEVRDHLIALSIAFALGILAVWFAVAYWSVLVVLLTWDLLGWKILLVFAVGFTILAAGLLLYAQSLVARGKLSLPKTMSELRTDSDAFL